MSTFSRYFLAILPGIALGMIGGGAFAIYPPAGPLVVGLLLWIDLSRGSKS
jgi:hypothetical protein